MSQLDGFNPQTKILERRLDAPLASGLERNQNRCEESSNIREIQRYAAGGQQSLRGGMIFFDSSVGNKNTEMRGKFMCTIRSLSGSRRMDLLKTFVKVSIAPMLLAAASLAQAAQLSTDARTSIPHDVQQLVVDRLPGDGEFAGRRWT